MSARQEQANLAAAGHEFAYEVARASGTLPLMARHSVKFKPWIAWRLERDTLLAESDVPPVLKNGVARSASTRTA